MNPDIPNVDPMPLPAPYWLFKLLLLVTFLLHILAMNFMFGGTILAAVARLKGKRDERYLILSTNLAKKLPAFFAATITLGIAPLLFLQVIYGQYFYTSSVIMAWPWFLVILLLIFAYYGLYVVAFARDQRKGGLVWVLIFSLVLLFLIGFFYTNNMTLMLRPEKWAAKYRTDPSGWNLNWDEAMLIPRYLHFLVASVAVGALLAVITGLFRWKKDPEEARFLIRFGGKWFVFASLVQIVVGVWFLVSLPEEKMKLYLGQNTPATVLLALGVIGAVAAVWLMSVAIRKEDPRKGALYSTGLTGIVVVFMTLMRDILRGAYLSAYFQPAALATKTQWDVLILFLFLFVGGVILWLVLLKRYFSINKPVPAE